MTLRRSRDVRQVTQKWGFGMSPVKQEVLARRQHAVGAVHGLSVAAEPISTTPPAGLLDQISEVKGLFSRSWKQDQWDWAVVWQQLGRPVPRNARQSAETLGALRRALSDRDPEAAGGAVLRGARSGLVHHLKAYLGERKPLLGDETGFVYVLSTREQPHLLKIGYTRRPIADRVAEINRATGVAVPFGVRKLWIVKNPRAVEATVHALLGPYRLRDDREFFLMEFREARTIIDRCVGEMRARSIGDSPVAVAPGEKP